MNEQSNNERGELLQLYLDSDHEISYEEFVRQYDEHERKTRERPQQKD